MPARRPAAGPLPVQDLRALLTAAGITPRLLRVAAGAVVFTQGDPATTVFHIQSGAVKLAVVSSAGKEAVVGMLSVGDFLGEGCLAGQTTRVATATAVEPSVLLRIKLADMRGLLRDRPDFSSRFIAHMLARNIRIEEDLVDHLFNSSEKRLARTLLLLARYGRDEVTHGTLPRLSQETLAEMVGTTRSRINFFMNKFRRLGLIEYNGSIKVKGALLSLVLHD